MNGNQAALLERAGVENECPVCKSPGTLNLYSTEKQCIRGVDMIRADFQCSRCFTGAAIMVKDYDKEENG